MPVADETFDAIIIGAGAAGLMCALTAGQRGRKVLLLEHTDKAGAKILISGGGRCNFTNLATAPDRFLSGNPHFCTSALRRYTQADFIELVRPPRHRLSREDAGPVVLRRLGARHRRHAAGRMRARRRRSAARAEASPSVSRADRFRVETDNRAASPRRRWCWRPAGCPSRRWARQASATTSRGASACASRRRCRGSCR